MIRFGAMLAALALVCRVIDPTNRVLFGLTLGLLTAGIVLLICAREPWPRCCPHCPVYSRRRARALEQRPEAQEIVDAAADYQRARRARAHEVMHERRVTDRESYTPTAALPVVARHARADGE